MSFLNLFALGFVAVTAGLGLATDYAFQAKQNGSFPGEYPVSSYVGSFTSRFDAQMASIDKKRRQSVSARSHLPEAHDGWERQDWDITKIDMDALTDGMLLIERMAFKKERSKAMLAAKTDIWEYHRGDEVIRLYARFDAEPQEVDTARSGWLTGLFTPISEPRYAPFAIVQGLPFLTIAGGAANHTLVEARIGTQLHLAAAGQVSPEVMRAMLEQIDIENLNLMLDEPLAHVGLFAPQMTEDEQRSFLAQAAAAMTAGTPMDAVAQIDPADTVAQPEATYAGGAGFGSAGGNLSTDGQVKRLSERGGGGAFGDKGNRLTLSGGRACLNGTGRLCQ